LDTSAIRRIPKDPAPHPASSAHTYRLLIFKDHSLRSSAFFASVIKREANYAMRLRTPSTLFAKLFFARIESIERERARS
ncbi:hypothetical protein P3T18_006232, partial [Paraburkholderia sp. GAS199]|uniref:hypothetical protein n=1 Tax=Paraburkholderia sp. GAS199 TaxID=3035126 RepID=UPI003D23C59C